MRPNASLRVTYFSVILSEAKNLKLRIMHYELRIIIHTGSGGGKGADILISNRNV